MNRYCVWVRSVPGFYEQYNPKEEVFAKNEDEAIEQALKNLKRGAFPERSKNMWRIEKVERVY